MMQTATTVDGVQTIAEEREQTAAPTNRAGLVSRIVIILGTEDRVTKSALRSLCGDCTEIEFGLALHDAREQARTDFRVEFIPDREGGLVRATAKQKLNRAAQFNRTANRKRVRVGAVLAAVDPAELAAEDQERLQMARDKNALGCMRDQQIARMRRVLPEGNDTRPEMPRRGR